jgi:hypothetical protein
VPSSSGAIIRVFCVDGPCEGLHYVNLDTGRVLFSDVPDSPRCVYRVSIGQTTSTEAGPCPVAYLERLDPPLP